MSLFRRDSSLSATEHPPARTSEGASAVPRTTSHLASGTRVDGNLGGSADLVVDGELVGDIAIEGRVMIGGSGRVTGAVRARSIRLAGRIEGHVVAVERVEVVATGHLEGDISAPRVIIAEGAFFKGSVEMSANPRPAKERKS